MNSKHVLGHTSKVPVEKMGSDFAALDFSFLFCRDLTDSGDFGSGSGAQSTVEPEDNTPLLNILSVSDSTQIEMAEAVLGPDHLE